MGGIFNYDKIKRVVEDSNYKLINVIFADKARNTRIIIQCPLGHQYETSWNSFSNGHRCSECKNKESGINKRRPVEEVYSIFESHGYTVITPKGEYGGTYRKTELRCPNGHKRELTLRHFEKVPECPKCNNIITKYTYEEVEEIFNSRNYTLLSETYVDSKTDLEYICDNGHHAKNNLYEIKNGAICSTCNGIKRYTYDEVGQIFKDQGCELLSSEYINYHTPLEYKCVCGNPSTIALSNFIKGHRCMKCYNESRSGENSPYWNPNLTDDERMKNRKYLEYKVWRRNVYERDNYTCLCCSDNKGGNLNAHHLDGHDWCKEKRLDVENGITLCESCHVDFHKTYGFGDNTKEQFEEYLASKNKIRPIFV